MGWHPAGETPNEQEYWDGERWTSRRRWVHSAWVDLPMEADESPGRVQPPRRRRVSTVAVVLLVLALAALGGLVFALTTGGNSASPPSATHPTTVATTPTPTSTPTSIAIQQASAAQVAACEADAKTVELALAAYQAQKGAYPSPPAPWGPATYAGNYAALTSAVGGGPYLDGGALSTSHFVVEYDSSGHVWVTPPGGYDTYDHGQDFDANPDVCQAAVR